MEGYDVGVNPANIAPTVATRTTPVEVFGQPRNDTAHPNIFWDQEDIEHYKEMLKTSKELQIQLANIKDAMDQRIATPIAIPPPQKGPDGKWLYPGNYFPVLPGFEQEGKDPNANFRRRFQLDSEAVSDLGTLYALTGETKYADYAKKLLLSYAVCSKYGTHKAYYLRSNCGEVGALHDEALILQHFVRGYDLIYNLPSWTKEERIQLHDEFFYPYASCQLYPSSADKDKTLCFATQPNNRGVFGAVEVTLIGYVTEDQELINAGLYGIHTDIGHPTEAQLRQFPPPHDWIASTAEHPTHGLLTRHFAEDCIPGGMWVEGSPSYAFYALCSMVGVAEALWHHGIDLYRHNNCIFKNMFDFPLLLSYPDLTTPGLNDGHRGSLYEESHGSTLYEYAYRRYRDPRYLAIINSPAEREYLARINKPGGQSDPNDKYLPIRNLTLGRIGCPPPSLLFDLDPNLGSAPVPPPSANYALVGFGILRTPAFSGSGVQSLILSSGPAAQHGHPDKLQIDLFAFNDVLMPSPGVNYPYGGNMRIPNWYQTTVAHNTLGVDEKPQEDFFNNQNSHARADQVVFGPASTVGIQRASTNSVYSGVTLDRAVFMTSGYLADLFGAFSAEPHQYDLAWHIRGEVNSDLKFTPLTFPEPVAKGYNTLTNVRQAVADNAPWSVTLTREGHSARLHAAKAPATQVIVGDGGFYVDSTSKENNGKPTAPTILERREKTTSTIYGNALDYSDSKDGYVKNVTQEGGLDVGYGLLRVQTTNGTDLCFASYRPGNYNAEGLQTDALQAFVQMSGRDVQTLYLAGGKSLQVGGASITRSEEGLTYVEKTATGSYLVGNPSSAAATVTVTLPALAGLKAFNLDDAGKRTGPADVQAGSTPDSFTIPLKPSSKVEFASS